MKVNSIKSASDFVLEIERLVDAHTLSYMDAIMLYVEKTGVEVETVASMVRQSTTIKSKLQIECEELNLMVKL